MKEGFANDNKHKQLTKKFLGISAAAALVAFAFTTTLSVNSANAVTVRDHRTPVGQLPVKAPSTSHSAPVITKLPKGVLITTNKPLARTDPNAPAIPGHTYVFKIDKMNIKRTRSLRTDTDHLTMGLVVGGLDVPDAAGYAAAKELGDVRTGVHAINQELPPAFVPDSTPMVRFTYNIANAGSSWLDKILPWAEKAIELIAPKLLGGTGTAIAAGLPAADAEVRKDLPGFFKGGCDGMVAVNPGSPSPDPTKPPGTLASYLVYAPGELAQATDNPTHTYTETDHVPGIDSAHGCGRNSIYDVTWSITRVD